MKRWSSVNIKTLKYACLSIVTVLIQSGPAFCYSIDLRSSTQQTSGLKHTVHLYPYQRRSRFTRTVAIALIDNTQLPDRSRVFEPFFMLPVLGFHYSKHSYDNEVLPFSRRLSVVAGQSFICQDSNETGMKDHFGLRSLSDYNSSGSTCVSTQAHSTPTDMPMLIGNQRSVSADRWEHLWQEIRPARVNRDAPLQLIASIARREYVTRVPSSVSYFVKEGQLYSDGMEGVEGPHGTPTRVSDEVIFLKGVYLCLWSGDIRKRLGVSGEPLTCTKNGLRKTRY